MFKPDSTSVTLVTVICNWELSNSTNTFTAQLHCTVTGRIYFKQLLIS